MGKRNIKEIYNSGLCMGCGICQDVCPHHCITIRHGNTNIAYMDTTNCIDCGLCYAVCPGKGIRLRKEGGLIHKTDKYDRYIGNYISSFVGYSTNRNIRFHAASGGLVTQFLVFLFDHQLIDGAVVVGQQNDNKLFPKPYIARNSLEVLDAKSSKYCVTSYENIITEIKNNPGRYVIVGLPCHIQAFRQYEKLNRLFRKSVIGYFAIYCSLNKTRLSTEYYLYRYGINKKNIGAFAYRDEGCPGYMKFSDKQGRELKRIPYVHFWMGTHNFFTNPRCLLCFDQLGELADVSFGDINISPYNKDTVGISSLVVRDEKWMLLLQKAENEGYIELEKLNKDELVESQRYVKIHKKGRGIAAALKVRKIFNKKTPMYDDMIPPCHFKDIVYHLFVQMMINMGRHKIFWNFIKRLDPYRDYR